MTVIQPLPGITLELCPERVVSWQAVATVFVADLHLGRSTAIPTEYSPATRTTLQRLSTVIERYAAKRLIILGDAFHMRRSYSAEIVRDVREWRERWRSVDIVLVRGNHERVLGDPPAELGFRCVDPGYVESGLMCVHEPRTVDDYTIGAHLHPSILVPSTRVAAQAVPCFVIGTNYLVLPAFEDLLPGRLIRRRPDETYAYIQQGAVYTQ
jgi:DNA ligase-associated metallophosphoesterase